jgi:predicted nicotinamide N-methyase
LSFFKTKSVLELGAGTGVVSIALQLLQADVIATDLQQLVPLIARNFKRNGISELRATSLPWGHGFIDKKLKSIETKQIDEKETQVCSRFPILLVCIMVCFGIDRNLKSLIILFYVIALLLVTLKIILNCFQH